MKQYTVYSSRHVYSTLLVLLLLTEEVVGVISKEEYTTVLSQILSGVLGEIKPERFCTLENVQCDEGAKYDIEVLFLCNIRTQQVSVTSTKPKL